MIGQRVELSGLVVGNSDEAVTLQLLDGTSIWVARSNLTSQPSEVPPALATYDKPQPDLAQTVKVEHSMASRKPQKGDRGAK